MLLFSLKLPCNKSALQFLQDLLYAIKRKAERKRLTDVLNFVSSFYRYGYGGQGGEGYGEINYEGGGIGIIHTTMNLGGRRIMMATAYNSGHTATLRSTQIAKATSYVCQPLYAIGLQPLVKNKNLMIDDMIPWI